MNTQSQDPIVTTTSARRLPSRLKIWAGASAVLAGLIAAGVASSHPAAHVSTAAPALPSVAVSHPLQRSLDSQLTFLGQYSAVDKVELRAQVGGTLSQINFRDGDVVHKGDVLFVIDTEPYQIKLSQAQAQLEAANARLALANQELVRAQTLKATDAGSTQNVEQRVADKLSAQAAVDGAQAQVRDARFDLDHTRVTAPFTGRIGNHLVSVGNLVAGSRGAASPTTLLTTLVSLDSMYLDFDMSEADYNAYVRGRAQQDGHDKVAIADGDTTNFAREGTLNFIDNALDRSSGTIHVRATVPNADLHLTPGGFARVRLSMSKAEPALLVPDASVLPDQASHFVMTVSKDGTVAAKPVEIGDLRGGLRVIRSGLLPTDEVVIDSIPVTRPGSKVAPHEVNVPYASGDAAPLQVSQK
jgi:RND family efflux transporter MFP subunit